MSEPDKNGGKGELPHSVFRVGDKIELLADAEHRKVDELAKWRAMFERLLEKLFPSKE